MKAWVLSIVLVLAGAAQAAPEPGAAVQAARAANTAEAAAKAAATLASLAPRHPAIETALKTVAADAWLRGGAAAKARALAEEVAARDARWANRAHWIAARAAMALDDARAALDLVARTTPDAPWVPPAERLLLEWQALLAAGEPAPADAVRRRLAIEQAHTSAGARAATGLPFSDEERLARAAAFERARDYPAALGELEHLLRGPRASEARFRLGKLHLERIREDFSVAARAFAQVISEAGPDAEEASYLLARTLGRAGDAPGARTGYAGYLKQHPNGRWADDAWFFSAFLEYELGRYGRAAKAFAEIERGKWRGAARWYRAWSLYLAGDPEAVRLLDAAAKRAKPGSEAARQAAYWAARALAKRAPKEARGRRARLVAENPRDWYALLLRRRHPGEFDAAPGLPRGAPPTPPVPERFAAAVAEVRALHAAGLDAFARRALAGISEDLRRADRWPLEAALAREIGDAERLYRSTMIKHHDLLDAAPRPHEAAIWYGLYPEGHPDAVGPAARRHEVEAEVIYSFIRKESAFDVDAVSPAHAVGLMQLLPRTAAKIKALRGLDGPAPDLFDPAVNVDYGAWYLAALAERFAGQLPLVAAAYNAGPESVLSWFDGRPRVDTDVFVDTIPFKETRGYVKRLVQTRVAYRMIYGGEPLAKAAAVLPLTLDLAVRPGVDF